MKGAVLYGPRDVRFEERRTPEIVEPTDAIVRTAATCVCGSDLWPYRGLNPINGPTPMGHEYCGIVEEVGSAVKMIKTGQFVIGSFFASDNTCPHCQAGYQSSCEHRSSSALRRRRCCGYRSRTGRLWRRPRFLLLTWSRACWRSPTSWARAGSPPSPPTSSRARRLRSSVTAQSVCLACSPPNRWAPGGSLR
jgi:hypothetical protein